MAQVIQSSERLPLLSFRHPYSKKTTICHPKPAHVLLKVIVRMGWCVLCSTQERRLAFKGELPNAPLEGDETPEPSFFRVPDCLLCLGFISSRLGRCSRSETTKFEVQTLLSTSRCLSTAVPPWKGGPWHLGCPGFWGYRVLCFGVEGFRGQWPGFGSFWSLWLRLNACQTDSSKSLTQSPKVVPFWGSYIESYKGTPKRNYFGASG